ncbi:energy-coupled thiamine transporter ThiT [Polycladomyces subterraneus]|uniref:Energy-coupled thiamine transporter ThiT n=1 Tax=Polycladomyces subterraneus TaxID=1016997 RepID=A0ABT8IJ79_9BACL|nr:energy-coupled thiamine transporter ThiT [Polycladomyces subterraneus]MDN4592442.1 energy-coupled thiamine transporter ThiT [Polycladomyces subterraneus]
MTSQRRLLTLTEIAIMAAIGVLLSTYVKIQGFWPQGGSISLVMLPIALLSFRRGWVAGVICGLLVGLINLMVEPFVVHPVQVVLDYPLAFAALGLSGVFAPNRDIPRGKQVTRAILGLILAGGLRLLSHFISGVIWFGQYAPKGMNVAMYSFLYNVSYILPDVIIAAVLMTILITQAPQLVMKQR